MAIERDGFFKKSNLHQAGWTTLVGVVGFMGALTYHKVFGPPRVVIEAPSSGQPAAMVISESPPGWPSGAEIRALADAIRTLRGAAASPESEGRQLRALSEEVDRLRERLAQGDQAQTQRTLTAKSNPLALGAENGRSESDGSSQRVTFSLPKNVRGYTPSALIGVKDGTCPPETVAPQSPLVVTFYMVDTDLIPKVSPVRMTVVRERSATDFLKIIESYSHLQPGENILTLSPKLSPGSYRLTYGFYLRDELSVEFPNYYSRECRFVVALT